MTSFSHSGKLGDIVYSLAAVQVFGETRYYIKVTEKHLSETVAKSILPLLECQPNIAAAKIWSGEVVDHNLDRFRNHHPMRRNLADCHLKALGLDVTLSDRQWLQVPEVEEHPVVFARSLSFRGIPGFWEETYRLLGKEAIFVGTEQEHEEFEFHIGDVAFRPTQNLLELAQVIAGTKLFIGNQSCPYAIAEGLKRPAMQEVYLITPNCVFPREEAAYITHPSQIAPALEYLTSCKTA